MMRSYHKLIFDDAVNGTTAVYTVPDFNRTLAMTELIEIFVVATQVSGTSPTLTVREQVGPDNRTWLNRSGTAEINAVALSTTEQTVAGGRTNVADGTGGFARLEITLGGTSPRAHLRIYVTGRGEQVLGD